MAFIVETKHITESTKMAFYQSLMQAAIDGYKLSNLSAHSPREFPGLYTIVLTKTIEVEDAKEPPKEPSIKQIIEEKFAEQKGAARPGRPRKQP